MIVTPDSLIRLVEAIFAAAGCGPIEAATIARRLVEANLVGHDSHGVVRVPAYIEWLRQGKVVANRALEVLFETDVLAVVDGHFGFGQVIGEQAVQVGVAKAARQGIAVVALRNCGHLGRIGDWPLLAAEQGLISLHFVNTSGLGNLVAPTGGIERRLSANPIAAGVPVANGPPLLLDISTAAIAEGKIKVALNRGVRVPAGCLIDAEGQPTDDPRVFYGDPPGAILPFGGHKGYGLSVLAEMLAGALTGNGCTALGVPRLSNGMLSFYLDPARFRPPSEFHAEVTRFIEFLKSARRTAAESEILVPGEIEVNTRRQRAADGVDLDAVTWQQISATATSVEVDPAQHVAP